MILSLQTLACDRKLAPLVERVKGSTGNYSCHTCVKHIIQGMLFKRPNVDFHDFCASIIVLVYMIGRFPLFFNAARFAMHPGQNWLFEDPSVDVCINRN